MNKKVTIYNEEYPDIPEDIAGFMAFWNEKIDKIPNEFKNSVRIELESESSYGNPCLEVSIYYHRPETDEECQNREERENLRSEAIRRREPMNVTKGYLFQIRVKETSSTEIGSEESHLAVFAECNRSKFTLPLKSSTFLEMEIDPAIKCCEVKLG